MKTLRIINTHVVNGNYIPNLESCLLDGKPHEERTPDADGEAVKTAKPSLKKNNIEIEVKVSDAKGNRSITLKELELSRDGRTLTPKTAQELKYFPIGQNMDFPLFVESKFIYKFRRILVQL